jgi:hypothetical protein
MGTVAGAYRGEPRADRASRLGSALAEHSLAVTAAIVIVAAMVTLVVVAVVAVTSLPSAGNSAESAKSIAAIVGAVTTVLGTIIGAFLGARVGSEGKEAAHDDRRAAERRTEISVIRAGVLAAALDPERAHAAYDQVEAMLARRGLIPPDEGGGH